MTDSINTNFKKMLKDLNIDPDELKGKMTFLGEDPIIPSVSHAGEISALTRALPSYLAALIWQRKTGEGQNVTVDLRKTLYEMSPFFPGSVGARLAGVDINLIHSGMKDTTTKDISLTMYQTKDNRWFMPTAMSEHGVTKMTNFLKCAPNYDEAAKVIRQWDAEDLEKAFNEADLPGCVVRTPEEYEKSKEKAYLKTVPLIKITKIKDGKPIPFKKGLRPLSNINVLGETHILAGPTILRTLAEQGAHCMNLWGKASSELDILYDFANAGIRSAFVDLTEDNDQAAFVKMIKDADVFVENLHAGLPDKLGMNPKRLADISNKGIIDVSVRCYGHGGPKANLPGFDMHAVAESGFCYREGTKDKPRLPYTEVFNDFTAGFLAAAGAEVALMRRAKEGGSYRVEVSLARCTEFYNSLGFFTKDYVKKVAGSDVEHSLGKPDMLSGRTPLGIYTRLRPEVSMSETPAYWSEYMLVPRGSSQMNWWKN